MRLLYSKLAGLIPEGGLGGDSRRRNENEY